MAKQVKSKIEVSANLGNNKTASVIVHKNIVILNAYPPDNRQSIFSIEEFENLYDLIHHTVQKIEGNLK